MQSRIVKLFGSAILGLCLAAAVANPALAHAHLVNETPAADSVAARAPSSLTLKFSEAIELNFTGIVLTGPDKKPVATSAASLDPTDDSTLIVPLSATLASGKYSVEWHALARDGHRTKGAYSFTIAP
jgi:methionine-rich copper-binding protein CopC